MSDTVKFEKSSGNVFADMDLPEAEMELLRSKLAVTIFKILKKEI